jgi:hypothetical protein
MKVIQFTFKSEPVWMLVFPLASMVLGLLVFLLALLLRWLG